MMELTCVFLLIFACTVSPTPHGYGVKGGASARAESSASAGAFGGIGEIPIAVPLGAGFSGSFSKSSSSSYSSSSASASSSASSFSYSGSGTDDIAGFGSKGGAEGNVGCSSGNCQNAGINAKSPHGSSLHGYNTANAAAVAGAAAIAGSGTGSGCQGLNCDKGTEKCRTGQCKSETETGTPSADSITNKCESGQCGFSAPSGSSSGDDGANDIRVVTDSSDSTSNSKSQSSNIDKTSTGYNGGVSGCSQGNCSPSSSYGSKPSYSNGPTNTYQSTSNKQQSINSGSDITTDLHKPASHLEAPKESSKCNSPNCNSESIESGYDNLPTSYNVPIHGTYDKSQPNPNCDGVKCENQPKGAYSLTNSNAVSSNYLSPQHSHSLDYSGTKGQPSAIYPSSSNCRGSNCGGIPSVQSAGGPSLTVKPGNIQFGVLPSSVSSPSASSCNTPNCSPYPTNPVSSTSANVKPSDEIKPNEKLPTYTGGFGGPAGVFKPNQFDVAAKPIDNPSHAYSGTPQSEVAVGRPSTGCNLPSCSSYPTGSGANSQAGTIGVYKPSGDVSVSSQVLPTYTGGFGGPAGMLKPNEFEIHALVTNKPNYVHPVSSSYNTNLSPSNIGTTGCNTPHCGGSPSASSGASAPSASFGITKPSIGISSNEKLPVYTGGFGGPVGVFKPNEYDLQAPAPSGHSHAASDTYNKPSGGHSPDCKTPNCYPSDVGTAPSVNTQPQSFGVSKPSLGPYISSVTSPAYTSAYKKPLESTTPNEISAPALTPSLIPTSLPSSSGSYSSGCTSTNCASYPTSGATADANAQSASFGISKPNTGSYQAGTKPSQYTGSFGGPSGTLKPNGNGFNTPPFGNAPSNCKTLNCGNSPSANAGANAQSGSYAATKPSGGSNLSIEKLPAYTGGFGGASGILKPNDYTVPAGMSQPSSCTSGKCNDNVPHGSAPHAHNDVGGAHSTATAKAEANAVVYSGGFGGPPGVLKPYDDGKIGFAHTAGGHSQGSQISGHYSSPGTNIQRNPGATSSIAANSSPSYAHGNTGVQAGNAASSTAYSGAVASATSGASHGYNTHGSNNNQADNIKGGNPCGGGCGGTSSGGNNGGSVSDLSGHEKLGYSDGLNGGRGTAGATAKSLAGASAFGVGGSFASSSASAHASAGAYTKGGYGKR